MRSSSTSRNIYLEVVNGFACRFLGDARRPQAQHQGIRPDSRRLESMYDQSSQPLEMAIKIGVGKYRITDDFESLWKDAIARFGVLTIEPRHTARLIIIPFHHKDPFDRLLVAQALTEQIPLLSSDPTLDAYGIQRIW